MLLAQVWARLRNTWRALTSMGTALVLLFLLALGAIPGALLPQRSLNAGKVAEYLFSHKVIGPWLDRLQLFNVFSSFWFTAIYALLFVSLVGCLTPRMVDAGQHPLVVVAEPAARAAGRPPLQHGFGRGGAGQDEPLTGAGHGDVEQAHFLAQQLAPLAAPGQPKGQAGIETGGAGGLYLGTKPKAIVKYNSLAQIRQIESLP